MTINLLPFQGEDVEKLKSKRARLIGNDPGTGKTYEGIALDLLNRSGDGNSKVIVPTTPLKTLVIAPKSVLGSWDDHLMDLTDEDIYIYQYNKRHAFMRKALDPKRGGYFVINWDSIRIKDMEELQKVNWFHIIGDEIQYAKNEKAQVTRALNKLPTWYKTAMSGTPADNSPPDLWAPLHWLWPNYYTSKNAFVNAYCMKVKGVDKKGNETGYSVVVGLNEQTMPILRKEMAPWFVRRKKEDVLPDLPEKYYSTLKVDLSPKQRRAYDDMKKLMISWVEDHREDIDSGDPIIANAAVVQLIRLQQYTAGYLVPRIDPVTGLQVVHYIHKDHLNDKGKKPGKLVPIGNGCTQKCREAPQWDMTDPSAKLDALMEFIDNRPEEQIIVWSWSRAAINLLEQRIAKAGITYGKLTGEVPSAERDESVRQFQAGNLRLFIGTIKAGGVGITLTAARTVVFIDRAWNPAVNIQAEDRAHRIGQKNAVEIVDLVARNTIDAGKNQKIKMKWNWLRRMLGDEVDMTLQLDDIDLFSEEDYEEDE